MEGPGPCGHTTPLGVPLAWCLFGRLLAIPLSKENRIESFGAQCPEDTADPFFSCPFHQVPRESRRRLRPTLLFPLQTGFAPSTLKFPLSGNLESTTPCKTLFLFSFELTSVSYLKKNPRRQNPHRETQTCRRSFWKWKTGLDRETVLLRHRAWEIDLGGAGSCGEPSPA